MEYVEVPQPAVDPYTTEPTNYVQLLNSIRAAKNLRRLQHLIAEYATRFDAVHLSAALCRLPHLLRYRDKDLTATGVVLPTHGLRPFVHKPGAKPKDSHAQLAAQLAAQLHAMLPAHVNGMYPRQVANGIWALGSLSKQGVPVPSELVEALLSLLKRGNYSLLKVHGEGVDAVQLLKGLAHLQFRDAQLIETLAAFVLTHVQQLRPRELQMAAWSLVTLEYKDGGGGGSAGVGAGQVYSALGRRAAELAVDFLPQGISTMMWALAKAGVHDPAIMKALADGLQPQLVLVVQQDVAMVVLACTLAGYRAPPLLQLLGDKAARDLDTYTDLSMATLLSGFAALDFLHKPLMDKVVAKVMAQREVYARHDVAAKVCQAYARLDQLDAPSCAMLSRLLASFAGQLDAVRPYEIAMVCEALAAAPQLVRALGHETPAVLASIASNRVDGFSPSQLLCVLQTYNQLGLQQPEMYRSAVAFVKQAWLPEGRLGVDDGVGVLVECCRQGVLDPDLAKVGGGGGGGGTGQVREA